ncbi:MAG: aldolase/citrate lyase family protein [Pseudomonadota bacterium]
MKYMLITNDPDVASVAERAGVARIFVDLEKLGKQERQGHLDTHMSSHSPHDVARIRKVLTSAELLVRLNPLHAGTESEVEGALHSGADILMLPMFHSPEEVSKFVSIVNRRAKTIPLVETYAAAQSLQDLVSIKGVDEIYIGLNDLHLDMGMRFMFEPLANGYIDSLVATIKQAGLPFGFGGIARYGEGVVPGEMVLAEHMRLGSASVILSRTFHRKGELFANGDANRELEIELKKLISAEKELANHDKQQFEISMKAFRERVHSFLSEHAK